MILNVNELHVCSGVALARVADCVVTTGHYCQGLSG
jgi:uncharacterized membrane protein